MQALGASVPVIGLINALGSFGAMLLYPVGGYIADKSGRVRLVASSTIIYVSSFIIYLLAPSWEWAAVAMIYQNMSLFYTPAMNAIMADSIPVGDRGKLYGFNFA
jgi:MFS family permease